MAKCIITKKGGQYDITCNGKFVTSITFAGGGLTTEQQALEEALLFAKQKGDSKPVMNNSFANGRAKAQAAIAQRVGNAVLDTPADKRFNEGYAAGKKRANFKSNPYKGDEAEDWIDGYSKAENDAGTHSAFRKGNY